MDPQCCVQALPNAPVFNLGVGRHDAFSTTDGENGFSRNLMINCALPIKSMLILLKEGEKKRAHTIFASQRQEKK